MLRVDYGFAYVAFRIEGRRNSRALLAQLWAQRRFGFYTNRLSYRTFYLNTTLGEGCLLTNPNNHFLNVVRAS
jgi:hypothetical protein